MKLLNISKLWPSGASVPEMGLVRWGGCTAPWLASAFFRSTQLCTGNLWPSWEVCCIPCIVRRSGLWVLFSSSGALTSSRGWWPLESLPKKSNQKGQKWFLPRVMPYQWFLSQIEIFAPAMTYLHWIESLPFLSDIFMKMENLCAYHSHKTAINSFFIPLWTVIILKGCIWCSGGESYAGMQVVDRDATDGEVTDRSQLNLFLVAIFFIWTVSSILCWTLNYANLPPEQK